MTAESSYSNRLMSGLRPYLQREALAAFLLGISSGFPYAMLGATLTTRLAQDGIDKKSVTAFSLAFLVYNLKFLWAPLVDSVRLPVLVASTNSERRWDTASPILRSEIPSPYWAAVSM